MSESTPRHHCLDGDVYIAGGVLHRPDGALIVVRSFCLETEEVPIGEWDACVDFGKCPKRRAAQFTMPYRVVRESQFPMNGVSLEDAKRFCAFRGKRLPTEAEWEFAAGSAHGWKYPWGNDPLDCPEVALKDCDVPLFRSVRSPRGLSQHGVSNMIGHVWEWTTDPFDPKPPRGSAIIRGGSIFTKAETIDSRTREVVRVDTRRNDLGFRCAKDF